MMKAEEFKREYNKTVRDFGDVLIVVEPREEKALRVIIMTDDYDIDDDKVILYRRGRKKLVTTLSEIIEVY